jgi:undecaprenyl diphosphate synthase
MVKKAEGKGIHLGIIPDGSRRWAKLNGIKKYDGSKSGEVTERIVRHIFDKHPCIGDLSIWALSTENLGRPEKDKELVYGLLRSKMRDLLLYSGIEKKNIKVNIVGSRLGEMPPGVKDIIKEVTKITKDNTGRTLNLCIGYGGREEILNAVMESSKWMRKNPLIMKLHRNVFERYLMIPRPLDILIRTGGERRLSGFMLYQVEYAELFFTDTLWPDFSTRELDKTLLEFLKRDRRFGK